MTKIEMVKFYAARVALTLVAVVLCPFMLTGQTIYAMILGLIGKASVYTNVKVGGRKIGAFEFYKRFNGKLEQMTLDTDQGQVALVHGTPTGDYAVGSILGPMVVDQEMMAQHFAAGQYTLVSCFNGLHNDFEYEGRSFVRDQNTNTRWCCATIMVPFLGIFITHSTKWVTIYAMIMQGQTSLARRMINGKW